MAASVRWTVVAALLLQACSGEDSGSGPQRTVAPPAAGPTAFAGAGGGGAAAVAVPAGGGGGVGSAGMDGAAGVAGLDGASGAAGLGGAGGMAGANAGGAGGMAGAAGGSAPEEGGVDPSAITLQTVAANQTVGLDFPRVAGALGYRVYYSSSPGVTPATGTPIDVAAPGYVHRGLDNGSTYHYVVASVLGSGEGPRSPEASATPGGEWALEQLGSGDFDDVVSGMRVPKLPIADRIHVLLLPEGYLEGELSIFHDHAAHDLGAPSNDVDRWLAEVFALEPYSLMKEAFVVWYLPRASGAHIGEGTTAFGTDANVAAVPLFAALDGAGDDAFPFPPSATLRNFVASFLLFDPARGRAGVSGFTTQCRDPSSTTRRIGCAFGIGHAHEFTHAFSSVRDEYLENDNGLPQASETSNVSPTNGCDGLPWAHLLEGRGINDTPNLIGAFGRPERGYHSELHCLMNGTHDNGQYWCEPSDERYTTLTLRPDRMCNYCRELSTYHVLRRTGIVPEQTGFETWKGEYRAPFYERFGVVVPPGALPQTLECNRGEATAVYEACVP